MKMHLVVENYTCTAVGLVLSEAYQRCSIAAEDRRRAIDAALDGAGVSDENPRKIKCEFSPVLEAPLKVVTHRVCIGRANHYPRVYAALSIIEVL
jgi:hypothetical protein